MLTSTGNAKIEGLLPSLNMTGTEYNIALAIFFIPYTLAGEPLVAAMLTHRLTQTQRYQAT